MTCETTCVNYVRRDMKLRVTVKNSKIINRFKNIKNAFETYLLGIDVSMIYFSDYLLYHRILMLATRLPGTTLKSSR